MRRMKCGIRAAVLAAAALLALLQGAALPAAAEAPAGRTVRVGFFAFDGYHMEDARGGRSGYGYDYLQYLSRYTNFSYTYVGYDKSWSEMQDMLEAGEIDLLTSAQRTPEREARFDFSDKPIGSSAATLTVRAGDERYMVDDYAKLDGIRIGLLEGNSRNRDLEDFARAHAFSYQPVYYQNAGALERALQAGGEIDAILTSNLRKIRDEWIIATFDATPFYIMVRKGDRALLNQLNGALQQLQADHPDLASILFKQYYRADSGDEIPYTAEERAYIRDRREGGEPVRVTINAGRAPVSSFSDGQAVGIIPRIAVEALRRTGLPYEFVATPPTVDARALLMRGEADLRFDGSSDFNEAERCGLRVTEPYLELPLSVLTRREDSGTPDSVAVVRNSDVVVEYVEQLYGADAIALYDSIDDCLDAVLSGERDAAFFQTYIAQRLVNADVRNRIREQLVPGYSLSFAVSATRADPLLFSIVDKAVLSLSEEEIDGIVLEETSHLSRSMSLTAYLYQHPVLVLALLAAAACFVIVLLLYLFRRRSLVLEREKAREFERFISYVCRANTKVVEIGPTRESCLSYRVEEGKVLSLPLPIAPGASQLPGVHPEDRARVDGLTGAEALKGLMETGGELYFECRACQEGETGPYRWFAYTFQGVPGDGPYPGRLMVFVKDIDQAKREEAAQRQALQDALTAARQAGEARAAFLSRMSHEIRTPLNAIIGYMTIARPNLQNPEKIGDCLGKSEFAARQLLNIVNDVLDLSAIESGRMKIAHEAFNIKELIAGLTSLFHTQSAEKGIAFQVRLKDLSEETLIGDQLRLNQVLMNLLSNAVKFTPAGGRVTLTILQKALVGRSVYLQFEVADTGIGISEAYQARLFQPFEQQDASTARKYGGTGLGLSISKNLVTMMNGTISVQSQEGRGTLFTVNLSFELATARPGAPADCVFSGLRALVLYDAEGDYPYLQTLLERLGLTSDLALSPEEALRLLADAKTGYDLCLIDWDSPKAAGPETARQLLGAAPAPAPALLAVAYEAPALPAQDGLIQHVILKPVFQSSLFDALTALFGRRTQQAGEAGRLPCGLRGARLLLAEDNPLNMEIATEILTGYGLAVDGARNGLEAAQRFESSPPGAYQAILMDIQMPVLNGYEAARRIRGCAHPQAGSIPIIALTADAFAEDINRTLAAGMDAHVSKPIDFSQLCAVLVKCIGASPAPSAGCP